MVEFTLPKNSRVTEGKTWPGKPGARNEREFRVYRWNPDDGNNPRVNTYKVDLDDDRNLTIDMTLTAPGCPVAGEMPTWVENAAMSVEGIQNVTVNMVYDPPWDASRMSEEAQVALNWW